MSARVRVKIPNIEIISPKRRFFQALALDTARHIRVRTESEGLNVDNMPFRPYTREYAEYRRKKGRTTRPNLSFTGRMMNAIGRGVRATKQGFKIRLSGEEGFKAWVNETRPKNPREFFGLDRKQKDRVFGEVTEFYTKANRLKKR